MKNQKKKFVIICDESTKKGKNYSYFYGGAILLENKYEKYSNILTDYKNKLNLGELKRTKITEKNYKDYINVLDLFFTFVKSGDIKIRIMFSPNDELLHLPKSLNESYTKFYHTFIINAFNIFYAGNNIELRIIFDELPENKEQCSIFKTCLVNTTKYNKKLNSNKVEIKKSSIKEVDSKKHIILQCIDVIVGLVDFYLNITKEELNNSKRAQAKYEVWKKCKEWIYEINNNFNIEKTTQPVYSKKGWDSKYSHFVYHQKK